MTQAVETPLPPIVDLLTDSIYYPSSGFDGSVVKAYGKECRNFVYCDYGVTEDALKRELDTFIGYNVLSSRPVEQQELIPNGWQPTIPSHLLANYNKYASWLVDKPPFAYWAVYQRKPNYGDAHGPAQFNLLYVCGEGVATYQALYWSNRLTARAIAIIKPGTGFGMNWTDFRNGSKALGYVVTNNPYGRPDFLISESTVLLTWDSYPRTSKDGHFCRYWREGTAPG